MLQEKSSGKLSFALPGISFSLVQLYHIPSVCFLLLTLLQFGTFQAVTTALGNETDRLALLAFKSGIRHGPQGALSSWNDSLHFCDWQGITCSLRHRRVTILDVQNKGLVGTLAPHIGNLSFLQGLLLFNNTFQGLIPGELGKLVRMKMLNLNSNSFEGEIPTSLARCLSLTHLGLGDNRLVGKFPVELTSLLKLSNLVIHDNNLTGGVPPSVGNLTFLESFSARKNPFGGSIPDSLGLLKNIKQLGLAGCELSGMIPPSLYNLSSLTILSVGGNQLHGNLPLSFGLMFPNLQLLQLKDNQFTGTLPLSMSNLSDAVKLELGDNNFSGKITNNFGSLQNLTQITLFYNNFGTGEHDELAFIGSMANCSNLEVLGIEGNQFGGVLPDSVGNLSRHLFFFTLGANQINGNIPSTIGNLVSLAVLGMDSNQFTGKIPPTIGNLQKLQRLALSTNNLLGKIPDSIGNLTSMNELHLEENRLDGTIPSSLGYCKNLLLLELSQNNLSGTIPRELLMVSSLSISLNLARNHLSGSLPVEVGNLESLTKLDVSENGLSGEIPSTLGGCTSLEILYLQENFFQGSIPLSMDSLRGIQNLDLSHNNLSGKIPTFLENISLKNLNLSFNDFEGELPMKGVFTNASEISIAGNYKLCGGIPELKLPSCTAKKSESGMPLSHILAISAASLLVLAFVSSITIFWLKKKRKTESTETLIKEPFFKVTYEQLLKATDGFSARNLIGLGSFGSVYRGILDLDEEVVVAVKVLNLQHPGAFKSFMVECETLRNIRHRNLVRIITSCSSVDFQGNDFKALVFEFMPSGSLEHWLHPCPESPNERNELGRLSLLQRIDIAIDVASAIDYLHYQCPTPIIHCDLKPSNVLLDNNMVAHVGDFGLARFCLELVAQTQSSSIGIKGTIGYAAPEYGLGSKISTSGDVYSYGILLLEMITGKRPTDSLFQEGLNLHSFAKKALPDHVMEIIDTTLPTIEKEEATGATGEPVQSKSENKMVECLVSMVKIGVACSKEAPQDRMNISNVLRELHLLKGKLQQDDL